MKGFEYSTRYINMRKRGIREKGFSIIEVISAIIILSILATLSVNLMSGYKVRQNITGARQQIMNAMTSALASAQRDNVPYVVVFNNHEVKACVATKCSDTSPESAVFYHDLTVNSRPNLFVGGGDSGSSYFYLQDAVSEGNVYLKFTPFGRIVVSPPFAGRLSTRGNDFFRFFVMDGDKVLKKEKLCIGIEFNTSGAIDSIETGATNGECR